MILLTTLAALLLAALQRRSVWIVRCVNSRRPQIAVAPTSTVVIETNPYAPPNSVGEADPSSRKPSFFAPKRGPAVLIAVGTLLGGVAGIPLLLRDHILGFFLVIPGAIMAGMLYRFASVSLPIDPTVRSRRYRYAAFAFVSFPMVTGFATGMQAQGFAMTIGSAIIGTAIATGILVSGDRRATDMVEP